MACLNLPTLTAPHESYFIAAQFNIGNTTVGDKEIEIDTVLGTITITRTGNTPVSDGGHGITWQHLFFGGGNFLALLRQEPSGADSIKIVDFTGAQPRLQDVCGGLGGGLPHLSLSSGNETLVFVWNAITCAICRSDDGRDLNRQPKTVSTVVPTAVITATQLVIRQEHLENGKDLPKGKCTIRNSNRDFGTAVIGASPILALAAHTETFTIRNDGNDCLTVTSILNDDAATPYTVSTINPPLPVELEEGDELNVDIVFAPMAIGSRINTTFTVDVTPHNGDTQITCRGAARGAVGRIATSPNVLDFDTLLHPGSNIKTFTITNAGELDLNITIGAAPAGSDFFWAPISPPGLALPVRTTTPMQNVTYMTSGDGAATGQAIIVTPSQGMPQLISCVGAGCVPNAEISIDGLVRPLEFGQVERGFRTVRFITVINNGDNDLTFTARISPRVPPVQTMTFGLVLPDHAITDAPPLRTYSVLPAHRCPGAPGATGDNTVAVAVSLWANDTPGHYEADLIIEGHNATSVPPPPATFSFPLRADIVPSIPVDIALVLDSSGSMAQSAGSRTKMEAALGGAKLLVEMLRDTTADRCAVIGFATTPIVHQAMEVVGPNRADFATAFGLFVPNDATNIAGGAIFADNELATMNPTGSAKKAMVVLTDGMENVCFQIGGMGNWYSITGRDANSTPLMTRPDGTPQDTDKWPPTPVAYPIHVIGLGAGNQIDSSSLMSLASAGTFLADGDLAGSKFFTLEKFFTQIFMATAGMAMIADPFFQIRPGERHPHQFSIMPGDINAMVVLYDEPNHRLPFYIESPKGEVLTGTSLPPGFSVRHRSTPTARFAELFFPRLEPDRYEGLWTVWIEHPGVVCEGEIDKEVTAGFLPGRCEKYNLPVDYGIAIGAASNLRIQPYVDPGIKYSGDPIRLNVEVAEAGLPVKGATVRVLVTAPTGQQYTVILTDDGAHQDGQVDDGDYGGVFTQTYIPGNYQLLFSADGVQAFIKPDGTRGTRSYHREEQRTKPVLDLRNPPSDGRKDDDCCRALLRALSRQEKLMMELLKERKS